MVAQLCDSKLQEAVELVQHQEAFMTVLCFLNIVCFIIAVAGNLVVIPALWKSSSINLSTKALFVNLAVSDLAVGLFVQPMCIVIIIILLNTATQDHHGRFHLLCPITMTIFWFLLYLFASSSFLSVAAIALDRLLAVTLHLRYAQLVTPKRVVLTVALLWVTSAIGATIFIFLRRYNDMAAVSLEIGGLLATSGAYFKIFKVARRHRNQIQSQASCTNQAASGARVKKSAFNTFYVYIIFLVCWLPSLSSFVVKEAYGSHVLVLSANYLAGYIVFLHSSINPVIFCWRYREIRQRVTVTLKKYLLRNVGTDNTNLSVSALQG